MAHLCLYFDLVYKMSAIQLLEKLGASAEHHRGSCYQTDLVRELAIQAMENTELPEKQWCMIMPAEPEDEPTEEEPSEDEKKSEDIRLN